MSNEEPIEVALGEIEGLSPKLFLNAMPKSGLHALVQACMPLMMPFAVHNWLGSFGHHSFTLEWESIEYITAFLRVQRPGTFVMGHMGYRKDIFEAMEGAKITQVIAIRDLRDVAVSQMYHIKSTDESKHRHDGRAHYAGMTDEELLIAIIEGVDIYAGLIDRWEAYAGWLEADPPWTLILRYEQLVGNPLECIGTILRFVLGDAAGKQGMVTRISQKDYDNARAQMLMSMNRRDVKGNFRRGEPGEWREAFTPKVERVFKEHAGDWLIKLGYAEDKDWTATDEVLPATITTNHHQQEVAHATL